jgi:hypothetical protein
LGHTSRRLSRGGRDNEAVLTARAYKTIYKAFVRRVTDPPATDSWSMRSTPGSTVRSRNGGPAWITVIPMRSTKRVTSTDNSWLVVGTCAHAATQTASVAACSFAAALASIPAASPKLRAAPPAAAASLLSAVNRNNTTLWTSVFTAIGLGDIAGFAAFRAVVQTVGTEAHRVLTFTNGAILLAGAVVLWFFALRTDHRSGHNASQQTPQTLPERIPCSKAPKKICVVLATTSSPRLSRRRPFFDPTWSAC